MLRSHWKKGHTIYLPKDYKFKCSISDLLHWLSAKSSEGHSFCWHLLNACPAWKIFSNSLGLPTHTSERFLVTCGATTPSYDGWFVKLLFCLVLILCQTVCRKKLSAWQDPFYTGHLPLLPFIIHLTRLWEEREELHGNTKPAVHLPFFRGFSEIVARPIMCEHMQTRMKQSKPYLLNLIDLGEKGKERNKETKASMNE